MIERETACEALNISVNEFGGVNLPYMLSIYEPDIGKQSRQDLDRGYGCSISKVEFSDEQTSEFKRAALVQELEGVIFLNPASFNENNPNAGWETSDEYLSGECKR